MFTHVWFIQSSSVWIWLKRSCSKVWIVFKKYSFIFLLCLWTRARNSLFSVFNSRYSTINSPSFSSKTRLKLAMVIFLALQFFAESKIDFPPPQYFYYIVCESFSHFGRLKFLISSRSPKNPAHLFLGFLLIEESTVIQAEIFVF